MLKESDMMMYAVKERYYEETGTEKRGRNGDADTD